MNTNITPGNIELPNHFWGTNLGNYEAEMVARNVAVMSMVGAWVTGEDTWLPFTPDDYRNFRAQDNPDETVGTGEMTGFNKLVSDGYLVPVSEGSPELQISGKYLGLVAEYVKK